MLRLSRRGVGQVLCVLPVVLSPLLAGTAGRPYTLAVASLCAIAGLQAALAERGRGRGPGGGEGAGADSPLRLSWFGLALLLALAVTLVQLLPLPSALRALLSPGSDPALRRILSGLGGYPAGLHALSTDPSATANEAARLGGYLCLLLSLNEAFSHKGDGARLAQAVYLSAGLVALLGLLAALHVPLPAPLAVTGEGVTRARMPACFLNSNHMAALLAVGAILTLGAAVDTGWPRRALLLALLALLDAALLGTYSRGGIVVGVLGQGAVLLWPRGIGAAATLRRTMLLFAVPIAVFALGLTFAHEAQHDLQERFSSTTVASLTTPGSKVRAWAEAWPLLRGHLVLGVGRGAFEDAFQGNGNSLSGSVRFVYLENEWLQTLVDFGVPTAFLLFGCLFLGFRSGVSRLSEAYRQHHFHPQRVAAFVALCAVALHNAVDFNLEVGGVALPVLCLCAVVGRGRFAFPRRALFGLSLAVLVAAPVLWWAARSHDEDGQRLAALAEDPKAPTAEVLSVGTQAVLRHPLDSYLSAVVAARLWQDGRPAAAEWVNRSLQANPSDILALRTSALLLGARGYGSQAAAMLHFAIPRGSYPQRLSLYRAALSISRSPAALISALPESPQVADEVLDFLATDKQPRWGLVRAVGEWGDRLHARGALTWLATAALAQGDDVAAGRYADRLSEGDPPGFLIANIAALMMERGRGGEAEVICRKALQRTQTVDLHLGLAMLLLHRGQQKGDPAGVTIAQAQPGVIEEARHELDTALGLAEDPETQARVHDQRAAMEDELGNPNRARQERLLSARLRVKK